VHGAGKNRKWGRSFYAVALDRITNYLYTANNFVLQSECQEKEHAMSTQLHLKEIERKAFRSTYQDGLWDIYMGLIVLGMSIFIYRPAAGYSAMNIILMVLIFALAYGLFWAGKKYITLPRMGQVRFGTMRKKKMKTLAIILGVFVLLQAGLVVLTAFGWLDRAMGAMLNGLFAGLGSERILVAAIGSLIVGTSMMVSFFLSDFPRGYYIALMMALAVFLMIFLNQPVYPVIIAGLILLPGLVLFLRFLKTYPLHRQAASYE
jgi:hypothetical protein